MLDKTVQYSIYFIAVAGTTSHRNDLSINKVDGMIEGFKAYQALYRDHILKLHW